MSIIVDYDLELVLFYKSEDAYFLQVQNNYIVYGKYWVTPIV